MRKTIREGVFGSALVRLVQEGNRYAGAVIRDKEVIATFRGNDEDDLWRQLREKAAATDPSFFGYDGARARFLRIFPEGFEDPKYLAKERGYKVNAKERLDAAAPLDLALTASGLGEAVLSAFRRMNLLSPYESTRIQDVLRGPSADAYIRGVAKFTAGDGEAGLIEMERALKPHGVANWVAATYLPFLWAPERHMFLKPEVTKEFAARVGHQFAGDYAPQLDYSVYLSLLDLVAETEREISGLGPRDRIDVQSFVWVVGRYPAEGTERR